MVRRGDDPTVDGTWRRHGDGGMPRSSLATGDADLQDPERSEVLADLAKLTVICAFFFLAALGARDLWNPNEPIYGRAVAEMAERGDWLIPTVNGQVFAEKPILYYWGALLASTVLGGVDELSLRLPSAAAGWSSVLLTYLLLLPYVGRRRSWLAALMFMTMYQVFWASRAVQMDILVLAAALGVIVPMSRWLDFGAPAARSLGLAGLAAGLGFAAKGPVAWVVPGLALAGYVASTGRVRWLFRQPLWIGVVVTVATAAPWYLMLWMRGEGEILYEMLFRQNVVRFVDAWDHIRPWWYYLEYLWIDYLPWSWLLPAAVAIRAETARERRLHRLSWVWILTVLAFFSMSESKRAPYILPLAPAIAALTSGVVDRWMFGAGLERWPRRFATAALGLLAVAFTALGVAVFSPAVAGVPPSILGAAMVCCTVLGLAGVTMAYGLAVARRHPMLAPLSLFVGTGAVLWILAVWALPAVDPVKSARGFSVAMDRQIASANGSLASYRFWDWRAGYSYYAERSIRNLPTPDELQAYWRSAPRPFVLAEEDYAPELRKLLPGAHVVLRSRIGSRDAFLFSKHSPAELAAIDAAMRGMDDRSSIPRLQD